MSDNEKISNALITLMITHGLQVRTWHETGSWHVQAWKAGEGAGKDRRRHLAAMSTKAESVAYVICSTTLAKALTDLVSSL